MYVSVLYLKILIALYEKRFICYKVSVNETAETAVHVNQVLSCKHLVICGFAFHVQQDERGSGIDTVDYSPSLQQRHNKGQSLSAYCVSHDAYICLYIMCGFQALLKQI